MKMMLKLVQRFERYQKDTAAAVHFCRKCGGRCKESRALVNPLCGSPEFSDGDMAGATLSAAADAVILDCFKCENCGHSFTASTNL